MAIPPEMTGRTPILELPYVESRADYILAKGSEYGQALAEELETKVNATYALEGEVDIRKVLPSDFQPEDTATSRNAFSAAIEEGTEGGRRLYIPAWYDGPTLLPYYVKNPTLEAGVHDGALIRGDGWRTWLKLSSTALVTDACLKLNKGVSGSDLLSDVTVMHLRIDGNYADTSFNAHNEREGLDSEDTRRLTLAHLWVHNVGPDAFDLDGVNLDVRILHNHIYDIGAQAMHLYGCEGGLVIGNRIRDVNLGWNYTSNPTSPGAIDIVGNDQNRGLRIIHNHIHGALNGIVNRVPDRVLIGWNEMTDIHGPEEEGRELSGVDDDGSKSGTGIRISHAASLARVVGNDIISPARDGIESRAERVEDNTVTDAGRYGIWCLVKPRAMAGNLVDGSGTEDFHFDSGAEPDVRRDAEVRTPPDPETVAREAFTTAVLRDQPVAWDSFNRTDGALGTADQGGSWTAHNSSSWSIAAGRARGTTTSGANRAATIAAGVADGSVSAQIERAGTTCGVVFRFVDASNWLMAVIQGDSVRLWKMQAGTVSSLAVNDGLTLGAGTVYRLSARFVGDALGALVETLDGTVVGRVEYTMSAGEVTTFGAATAAGMYVANAADARFDAFTVRRAV